MSSSFEFPELTAPRPLAEVEAEVAAERLRDAAAERVRAARAEGYEEGLAAGRAEVGPAVDALAAAL
ncbi:MAG TPA: hypothetical protein VF731_09505, partial [Solirubrobacterales bacterium]